MRTLHYVETCGSCKVSGCIRKQQQTKVNHLHVTLLNPTYTRLEIDSFCKSWKYFLGVFVLCVVVAFIEICSLDT